MVVESRRQKFCTLATSEIKAVRTELKHGLPPDAANPHSRTKSHYTLGPWTNGLVVPLWSDTARTTVKPASHSLESSC